MPRSRSTIRPPEFLVKVDEDFGVALRPEAVALRLQLGLQGLEVVDLAVEHHLDGAILVAEGLAPPERSMIDSRRCTSPTPGSAPEPFGVGPTVGDRVPHGREHLGGDGPVRIHIQHTRDAAHERIPSRRRNTT